MRNFEINRKTAETDITLSLNLDGTGKSTIDTGCGFLDHMLTLFARHGRFDLVVKCDGDTNVDYHHSAEDIGIVLGMAFAQALGDKRGIVRYGSVTIPMDESLILAAADISGRGGYYGSVDIPASRVGDFDTELLEEFFIAFCRKAEITMHLQKLAGRNTHHIIECCFKAAARALRQAVAADSRNPDSIPSTKGVL